MMGSEDTDARDIEKPEHLVYLDAYWIYQKPVTHNEFQVCVDAGECRSPFGTGKFDNPTYDDHPVVNVSWYDVAAYCKWAGGRLPTEAEWEKAARGTDGRKYPWGDLQPNCALANYLGCGGDTTPVGSYPMGASPYGVLDMAGNVWEWVADWYASDYYNYSPYENPTGPIDGTLRVRRGGSWNFDVRALRYVLPYETIGVLIGPSFPGSVRMSKENSSIQCFSNFLMGRKLLPVITGDRVNWVSRKQSE